MKEKYTIKYDNSHNTYYIIDNTTNDYLDYNLEFNTYEKAKQYLELTKEQNLLLQLIDSYTKQDTDKQEEKMVADWIKREKEISKELHND